MHMPGSLRHFFPSACIAALGAGTLLLALTGGAAFADVYIWKDPATGRTRMTNIPPPWVRDPAPRQRVPRVEVIREDRVMDPATALANPQPRQVPVEEERREAEAPQSTREFEDKPEED
jgi:hypothetical protein